MLKSKLYPRQILKSVQFLYRKNPWALFWETNTPPTQTLHAYGLDLTWCPLTFNLNLNYVTHHLLMVYIGANIDKNPFIDEKVIKVTQINWPTDWILYLRKLHQGGGIKKFNFLHLNMLMLVSFYWTFYGKLNNAFRNGRYLMPFWENYR